MIILKLHDRTTYGENNFNKEQIITKYYDL
jgi:hypothetical protein